MNDCILSIDASLSSTGYAVFSDTDVIEVDKITTKANKMVEHDRIIFITNTLISVVKKYNIKNAAMEDQFTGKNLKTSMQLSRLRGAIDYALRTNGVNVEYLSPVTVKQITSGKGNNSKEEVAISILRLYPNNDIVQSLGEFNDKQNKNKNSDMYDAIGIGYTYLQLRGL